MILLTKNVLWRRAGATVPATRHPIGQLGPEPRWSRTLQPRSVHPGSPPLPCFVELTYGKHREPNDRYPLRSRPENGGHRWRTGSRRHPGGISRVSTTAPRPSRVWTDTPTRFPTEVEKTPNLQAPFSGYLVFPRWADTGVGIVGHLETPLILHGKSRGRVSEPDWRP